MISNLKIQIPYKDIYSRLGYRISTTEISMNDKNRLEKAIRNAFNYCELTGIYMKLQVTGKTENETIINYNEKEYHFISTKLSEFIGNSNELYLLGATAGKEIVDKRNELLKTDVYQAVIFDAAGSELVEEYVNAMHGLINKLLEKEGKALIKRRYSPGYGDLGLNYQKDVIQILNLEKIGISASESFILDPEKSITAFAVVN